MRAVGLAAVAATCVIGLVVFPIPTSSQPSGKRASLTMSLPSRTPVTDGGGIVRRVPSCAIALLLVPTFIAQITGTSALILIAISASGLVLTNVTATTATGNDATAEMCRSATDLSGNQISTGW